MPMILRPEIKNAFEASMLYILQHDESGIFSNEGKMNEPRVVADNVQAICKQEFIHCFKEGIIASDFSDDLSRRSMGDIGVTDCDGATYYIDVKTHNNGTDFNMPNLTSIDRLSKFYSVFSPDNYFLILMVEYAVNTTGVNFHSVKLFPIENLSWSCLRIGALGKGQIQITDSNRIIINPDLTRKDWMSEFYQKVDDYYDKEIKKAQARRNDMRNRTIEWMTYS